MRNTFLEFEQPLAELENKIEQLRYVQADSAVDISDEISRLQQKNQTLAKEIYAKLTPWQTALVARHPQRPYTLDYVREIFTDFLRSRALYSHAMKYLIRAGKSVCEFSERSDK